jgi:hypothetical protein
VFDLIDVPWGGLDKHAQYDKICNMFFEGRQKKHKGWVKAQLILL